MSYGTDFLYTGSGLIPSSSNSHMYKAPIIAQLLHTIPRFNLTLYRTNNTFRIRDEVYLEVRRRIYNMWGSFANIHFLIAESGNIGLGARGPAHHFAFRLAPLLNDEMLRPKAEDSPLHHEPEGNTQRSHGVVLCGHRIGPIRQ